jgi:chromosome segregation ATPase
MKKIQKTKSKSPLTNFELEVWLEKTLREKARNAKIGSEDRLKVFYDLIQKIAENDEIFGGIIGQALNDLKKEKEAPSAEIGLLNKLIRQERKLNELKEEYQRKKEENQELTKQLEEVNKHIKRRQNEIREMELKMMENSEFFIDQRSLKVNLDSLFDLINQPVVDKEEEIPTEAPQIVSLRLHNETLREKIKQIKKSIEIAEDEIEHIKELQ